MPEGFIADSLMTSGRRPLPLVAKCGICELHKQCHSPKMEVSGSGRKGVLILGEAPGCVGGNTLIEVAGRNKAIYPDGIPIKQLVGQEGFHVYSFDINSQKLALGKVKKVWSTGVKKVYRVVYEWVYAEGKTRRKVTDRIIVTGNHPFLLKRPKAHDPFRGINERQEYLSIDQGLTVGHSIQPFMRTDNGHGYDQIGAFSDVMCREGRFLLSYKVGRDLSANEECHHRDEVKRNDQWDNLELLTTVEHARRHMETRNPLASDKAKVKRRAAMQSMAYRDGQSARLRAYLSKPENRRKRLESIDKQREQTSVTMKAKYQDPEFYYKYLLNRKQMMGLDDSWAIDKLKSRFPEVEVPLDNHKIVSIKELPAQEVFDMEVEKYHNFAANGIFVHNSEEDAKGTQFVGRTGQFLQKILRYIGVDMRRDCWIHNALSCRPGKDNVIKDPKAIEYCRPRVIDSINKFNPTVIILLGKSAVASIIGHVWKENVGGSKTWAGWKIPSRDPNCWIMPTYHPSYVCRENKDAELYARTYQRHLQAAFDLAGTRPWDGDIPDEQSKVEVIYDPTEAAVALRRMTVKGGWVSWDIETDRLKPDSKDRRIVAAGVCWRGKRTIAFPWRGEAIKAMKELLASPMPKIAHNIQFEKRWTEAHLGIKVGGWNVKEGIGWDSMNAAHVLDCRKGINSLKFQSFVRLGFPSYDDRIKPYLGSEGEGGNAPNRIDEVDMPSLLKYCGLDALLAFDIAMQQRKELGHE